MRARMNVYLTTGKKNYKYAYVAIKSLFEKNQNSEIYLYIVSEDLEVSDLIYENELAQKFGHHIIILKFDEEAASRHIQFGPNDHWAVGAMSSYWMFHELLPEDVDRIIAIESDTVVVGELSEIYHTDFDGNYVISSGPEHKPENHRNFMKRVGGECLTFVLSVYDVKRIQSDFSLEDILNADAKIRETAGNSMMELTFGVLFRDKIKYIPARTACIDENERYMEELGYDYVAECEKTAKIIHFSSYGDYSKPWNPVFLVPGYSVWWRYAVDSPYYKEYIERQWQFYNNTRNKQQEIAKNITYKNVLLCAMTGMTLILMIFCVVVRSDWIGCLAVPAAAGISLGLSILFRKITIELGKAKSR